MSLWCLQEMLGERSSRKRKREKNGGPRPKEKKFCRFIRNKMSLYKVHTLRSLLSIILVHFNLRREDNLSQNSRSQMFRFHSSIPPPPPPPTHTHTHTLSLSLSLSLSTSLTNPEGYWMKKATTVEQQQWCVC